MTSHKRKGFATWLQMQRERDDPIGDLARDWGEAYPSKSVWSWAGLDGWMEWNNACDGARRAARTAWDEFRAWKVSVSGSRGSGTENRVKKKIKAATAIASTRTNDAV